MSPSVRLSLALALAVGAPASAADPVLAGLSQSLQGIWALDVGDLDGDGFPDIVAAATGGPTTLPFSPAGVYRLNGRGDGSFELPELVTTDVGAPFASSVDLVDVNGDDHLDLVLAPDCFFPGLGDGTFGTAVELPPGQGFGAGFVAQADFDDDGDDDLLRRGIVGSPIGGTAHPRLILMLSAGDGSFTQTSLPVGQWFEGYLSITSGDFDEDGRVDVVATVGYGADRWLRTYSGAGDGSFTVTNEALQQSADLSLQAHDADRDGRLDLLALRENADESAYDVVLHRGLGDGTFADVEVVRPGVVVDLAQLRLGDVDGNGLIDLLVAAGDGLLHLLPAVAPATYGDVVTVPLESPGFVSLTVAPLNGDDKADVVIGNAAFGRLTVLLGSDEPFVDLGGGLPGSLGTPTLVGSGRPVPGEAITLELQGGAGLPGVLFGGTESAVIPFLGGVLGPLPAFDALLVPGLPLTTRWPTGIPVDTSLFLQAFTLDPGTGFAATGTLAIVSQGE